MAKHLHSKKAKFWFFFFFLAVTFPFFVVRNTESLKHRAQLFFKCALYQTFFIVKYLKPVSTNKKKPFETTFEGKTKRKQMQMKCRYVEVKHTVVFVLYLSIFFF